MWLLNCKACDDVLKMIDRSRSCECGKTSGSLRNDVPRAEGPCARVLRIPWEDYDSTAVGLQRRWFCESES